MNGSTLCVRAGRPRAVSSSARPCSLLRGTLESQVRPEHEQFPRPHRFRGWAPVNASCTGALRTAERRNGGVFCMFCIVAPPPKRRWGKEPGNNATGNSPKDLCLCNMQRLQLFGATGHNEFPSCRLSCLSYLGCRLLTLSIFFTRGLEKAYAVPRFKRLHGSTSFAERQENQASHWDQHRRLSSLPRRWGWGGLN